MKGQTYVILAIIFTIIISVFAVLNIDQVEVNYLFWSGSSPLIFVILFSVLLGGILTMVVGSRKFFQLRKTIKHLEEQLAMKDNKDVIHVTPEEKIETKEIMTEEDKEETKL
ncbi:MAG TPA: lipopolysaccharide assembly protein LapA domain-containing protein [Pseudogracilibacillus sp.]|nr:lipopolysaccharide assembly protein LapA domain-containing protein [Pseudogracilibacillus sp.]